jgi:hypothetical protein
MIHNKATNIFIPSIPPEIWREIFIISVTSNNPVNPSWYSHVDPGLSGSTRPISSAHTSLRLSHVCTTWGSILLECGSLWCDVDLSTPRFAQLCLERSRPHNIHVFCRDTRRSGRTDTPRPNYISALELVFGESSRVESLRMSVLQNEYRPHYEYGISPVVTRIGATFPNLRNLIAMELEFTDGPFIPEAFNLDVLVTGASGSMQKLDLANGTMSFNVLCSLSLVTLSTTYTLVLEENEWRILFKQLNPTLKYLTIAGESVKHWNPPIILSNLQTLSIHDEGSEAAFSLHIPQATRITLSDDFDYDDDSDLLYAAGSDFAHAINQRFCEATSSRPRFHLQYLHDSWIRLRNDESIEFHMVFSTALPALSSLCESLDNHISDMITGLELKEVHSLNLDTEEEDLFEYMSYYENLAAQLRGVEEISFDEVSLHDFLRWFGQPGSEDCFPLLQRIQLSNFQFGYWHIEDTIIQMMDWRAKQGRPIELMLKKPGTIPGKVLQALRKKGRIITLVDM